MTTTLRIQHAGGNHVVNLSRVNSQDNSDRGDIPTRLEPGKFADMTIWGCVNLCATETSETSEPTQPIATTSSRGIHDHEPGIAGFRSELSIATTDKPGPGGANHRYQVTGFDARKNPSAFGDDGWGSLAVVFQNGPIGEAGANGVTNEALLAIVVDRLKSFQGGPFGCSENSIALTKCQEALHWLHSRTRERAARGVEGTNQK